MAYNTELVDRLREIIAVEGDVITEKKMFGGYTFLYHGKMTVGVMQDDLLVRVVPEKMEAMLARPGVRTMDFTGRVMKEFVRVSTDDTISDATLTEWVTLGLEHAKRKLGE